jgi:S1-C subfamily serine protease
MAAQTQDALTQLSDALAARAAAAAGLVAGIHPPQSRPRSGILWRPDIVVASEQVFPKTEIAEIVFADGRRIPAKLAGRDRGTNVVALRLETPIAITRPASAEPQLGGLALTFGADPNGAPTVRLGIVRSLGPPWHSLAGGQIDRRIALDLRIGHREEGGPVLDAAGQLLGMSTGGPSGRALIIPTTTVERVLDPLLNAGRIERGWLGVALHPVALLPDAAKGFQTQNRGLMVMELAPDGPCAKAGILVGDILVVIDGEPASRPREIARRFGPDSIGKQVTLQIIRSGAPQTVTATITPRPQG